MRKRLISILLMVCIVASLLSGLTVSAYADGNTVSHTMKGGETVIGICKDLGIDFFNCKKAIMLLNGFNSDADFNRLRVGREIKLPATDADAALIVASGAAGGTTGGATTGGTTGGVTGGTTNVTTVQLLPGDYIGYYLVHHVVQAGETVYDICNAMGINFHENSDLIMKVNSIKSWNRLFVGRTIMLPDTKAPASGSCVAVVAHKVVAGDTVYTLCQKYGISYKDSLEMLQILNKKENLAVIKVGQVVFIPISGVVTGGSGGVGGGGTVAPGVTPTPVPTPAVAHNINVKAPNGTVSIKVDGTAATKAVAGKTVSVSVSPNAGYAMDDKGVTVYLADNSGTVKLNADYTFTMPDCDVRVEAGFVSGYKIKKVNENAKGTFELLVNDVATQAAPKGEKVVIKVAPKEGYAVEKITVVGTDSKSSWYAWTDGSREHDFPMPGEKVTVTVTYKSVATYTLTKGSVSNGTFSICNDTGSVISKYSAGNPVVVVPKANDGYEIDTVSYTYKEGKNNVTKTVVDSGSGYEFTMPAANTTVNVTFRNVDMYEFELDYNSNRGSVTITVGGIEVEKAAEGETVTVTATPKAGNRLSSIKLDEKSLKGEGNSRSFTMPKGTAKVKVVFMDMKTFEIKADSAMAHGTYTLEIDGTAVNSTGGSAYEGQKVLVVTKPDADYNAGKIKVKYTDENGKSKTMTVENGSTFDMPASDVTISPVFNLKSPAISFASAANGSGKAYVAGEEVTRAKIGETVTIELSPADGYGVKSVEVKDNGGNVITLTKIYSTRYTFVMPSSKVTVTAEYEADSYKIYTASISDVGSTFTLKVNGEEVTDSTVTVKTDDKITIVPKPATNSSLDKIIVTKDGDVNTVVSTAAEFTMPAYDVKITVYFK